MAFAVTKWTEQAIRKAARGYKYYHDFRAACPGAIPRARRLGIHDEITAHMALKQKQWNLDSVRAVAAQFEVKDHFARAYPGAMKWAKRHGLYDDVCSHMKDNRRGDFDAVYIWKVKDLEDVYKIGVTSHRLGNSRINFVSRLSGCDVEFYFVVKCDDACEIEAEMLRIGNPFCGIDCNGGTEFRELSPSEFVKCLNLMGLGLHQEVL